MMPPAFSTSLSSPAFWDFARSNPVHSRMLSAHLFFNLPLLRLPRTVSCRIVFDERETCPCHFSLRFFKAVSRSLWGLIVVIQKHKITALFLLVIIYRSTRSPRYILLLPIGESHIHPSKKHRNVDEKVNRRRPRMSTAVLVRPLHECFSLKLRLENPLGTRRGHSLFQRRTTIWHRSLFSSDLGLKTRAPELMYKN